ncbi:DUF2069 domain-containing protein [Calidifontimicrobium sp. SYSU G02091]|uniref:DUF2069 domain-containing protein n=1 Tax=Calidifontimicrobium sp. SYSU G02091 TaxID=2926421 RepID=UPI001F52CC62|nr:DUF2069 domain-containing protein [Calidifontimicrobium sp. SYSU G02091]MCI1192906.1 DUF2069 domain-containing protein [Calidifontimicrobium sp. SYSU G02091]
MPDATTLPAEPAAPDGVVRLTRAMAVGSLLAMIVLGLAWELWLAPTGNRTLVLKVLPLAIPIAGLLKHRMYTYRWVSLLVWLYFTEGVVRATSDSGLSAVLAAIQVVLCLVLFTACALHVRWRFRQAAGRGSAAVNRT